MMHTLSATECQRQATLHGRLAPGADCHQHGCRPTMCRGVDNEDVVAGFRAPAVPVRSAVSKPLHPHPAILPVVSVLNDVSTAATVLGAPLPAASRHGHQMRSRVLTDTSKEEWYAHTRTYTHIHAHTHKRTHIRTHTYTRTHTHTHAHTRTHTHTRTDTRTHTHTHMHARHNIRSGRAQSEPHQSGPRATVQPLYRVTGQSAA